MPRYIINIGSLYGILPAGVERLRGKEMSAVETIGDAWLAIDDAGTISGYGIMAELDRTVLAAPGVEVDDAQGGSVLPAFCDSHTHIIYAGSREQEFEDKIRGLSYAEIAKRGGGILNSVDRLRMADEDTLYAGAMERAREVMLKVTGALEIKSGYGLSTADELKMLRVARRIAADSPLEVKTTFLGAHAVPREYIGRQDEYVELICREMLPAVAAEGLADYVDVFCDEGFFTIGDTDKILNAAARYGLRPKIHANELACSGGVQVGVAHGALSVDHLERMGAAEIEAMRGSRTVATMLPGASFFLGMPYAPAREAIDAGLTVALASDYNPGSSPSGDMRFVMALGCIRMHITPEESLNAVTINGAAAMDLSGRIGSITVGKAASLIVTKAVPGLAFVPYAYNTPIFTHIYLKGHKLCCNI